MRIRDLSSDLCSSDLPGDRVRRHVPRHHAPADGGGGHGSAVGGRSGPARLREEPRGRGGRGMTEGTSSCRPARLVRFRDTTGAMGDGLTTRFNALDEALATYRATCEAQYRLIPTAETTDLLHEWRSALVELGEWTGEVGASFIRTQVVDAYTDDELWVPDLEGPITMDDDDVVDGMDDKYHDDPERKSTRPNSN